MKSIQLICLNCNMQYKNIKDFKAHVRNYRHKQEVTKFFETVLHKGPVYIPIFAFLDYLRDPNPAHPLIGFDMVTMFITPERIGAFYLCHVCEKQLNSNDVILHLCSVEHYFRYLGYTNPELLHFAWLTDSFCHLQSSATEEYNTNGSGNLRVFELPKMMLKRCKKLAYHHVMSVFSTTDKLIERIQASIRQRKSIQEYIADPARTNPLLGLNLLLEYSCPKNKGYCGYLCILCKKRLPATESISHCISFDHVYWYLKAAHPGTLVSAKSSYSRYSYSLNKKIFYLAKQAQNLCPPKEIQCVHLDLACFEVVNSSSYASALEKLQEIWKDRNHSELNVSITPGERIMLASEEHGSSASTAVSDTSVKQPEKKTQMAPVTKPRDNSPCKILCVECDLTLNFIIDYKKHVKGMQHKQKLIKLFGPGQYNGAVSQIKLYQYMFNRKPSSPPIVGLQLLTVFVQRHTQYVGTSFYLCHACELSIPVSSVSLHLTSGQHCLNVFSYSKPDLVFLGSRNWCQIAQEQQNQENQKIVLKVCELPSKLFIKLRTLAYDRLIETIERNSSGLRQCVQAEKRMTLQSYSKCSERKSPLLGLQFMVKYTTTQPYFKCGYLCLLCEKALPERQTIVHVLSFAHMYTYLDMAHPGSLSKEESEQLSLILDLAQQAEEITSNMALREVDVSSEIFNEIEKKSFMSVVNVLQEVFKDKGLGELKPSIVPGAKLVSSFGMNNEHTSSKCEKQGHSSIDTQMKNVDETCIVASMQKTEEKFNSENPDLLHIEEEKLLKTTYVTSTHIQPAEPSLETTHLNLKSSEPSSPTLHDEQSESLKLNQMTLIQEGLPDHHSTENVDIVKHPQLQDSSVPQERSTELAEKPSHRLEALQKPEQFPDCLKAAVPQAHLSTCSKLKYFLETPNREPVIGLKTVIECCTDGQKPFYMCVTCVERFEESLIVEHLLSRQHRLQFLNSMEICDPEPGKNKGTQKWLRAQADMIEKMQGCGEAATLNLDAEDYHEILTAPIVTALENLRSTLFKLATEIGAQKPDTESDESQEPKASTRARETEEEEGAHAHLKNPEPDPEPETSKQNSEDPARSSPCLWSYLTSPTRTEPVIGLSMVTEYRNSNGQNSFLCSCCKMILATNCYIGHLIGPHHRFNYMKSKDPEFVVLGKDEEKILKLQKKAQILQDSEGWGCIKVVEKENKQPQKVSQQPLEDSEIETPPKVQKQEPPQTSNDADAGKEPQNLKSNEAKPTKQENKKKINTTVIDSENSVNTQKLEPPETVGDSEPQDHNSHEPTPMKQPVKKKINKRCAMIGLNFVTCVRHEKKKLFFCELCSVRGQMSHLDHMSSESHRKAYVEHKYPGYTASGTNMEKKLHKISLGLAEVEKSTGVGMKKLNVTAKVFSALRTTPLTEALSHLKMLQTKPGGKVDLQTPSPQPEHGTIPEHGTFNNYVSYPTICSAVTANCLQQEKASLPENPLFSEVHAPAYHPKHHHLSPPPLRCSTISSSVPSPSLVHFSRPFLSQPESLAQWAFVPHPLHEPISPPSASAFQDVPEVPRPYSYPAPFVYEPISPPPSSANPAHHETGQGVSTAYADPKSTSVSEPRLLAYPCSAICSHFTCSQPLVREENKHLHDTTQSKTYCLPKLPTVLEQSNAFMFLNVRGLSNTYPIIGLSNILECRRILHPTFFLCLNCAEKVSIERFCDHMTSERHQYLSIKTQYQEEFQQWRVQTSHQMSIWDLAKKLALTEKGLDAKVIKLNQNQYESLSSADFHDAIEILQRLFGPCMDERMQPSHLASQKQRSNEISTKRSPPESVKAGKERAHQSHQSCENTIQIKELHHSKVPFKEMNSVQENHDRNGTECTSMQNQLQQSQSTAKALPESKAQTPQLQHQLVVPTDLTIRENVPNSGVEVTPKPAGNSRKPTDLKYITKHRTEADALVGLSAVIECRSKGQASLYLCVSCSSKLDHDLINYHLVKPGHRYSYLKRRYPDMFESWSGSDSRPAKSMKLMQLAHIVERANEDEPGQLQVMKLKCDDLKEIKAMSYDKAVIHLQRIIKKQNLHTLKTCISPKIRKKLIKQERMETNVTGQYLQQQPVLRGSRKASKRRAVEQDLPLLSFPVKKHCSDVSYSHFEQSPAALENKQELLNSPLKQNKIILSDAQPSALTTADLYRASYCTPATVSETFERSLGFKGLDPVPQTFGATLTHKTVLKNCSTHESFITEPQEKDTFSNASTSNALLFKKGQEVARLTEKRPLPKKSLSENSWNHEIRQFSPETPSMTNTNPVAENSTETVAMKQQSATYSVHNYNKALNSRYNWKIPDNSLITNYGTATTIFSSQVTPEYAITHQYPIYQHPSIIAVPNTVASDYLMPAEMNYESAAEGISTNGTDLMNAISAHTSHSVYAGVPVYPQVYQPIQSPQNTETSQAYYTYCSYNQALGTDQTAAEIFNSTPALEHGVYPLASWSQKKK